ncbi:MAG: hypothetical protein KGJ66_14685 [Alphaproteobacteria bacterium]|nr:hypothetical protein [Alphaproteobacteria bacterium]
MMQLITSELYGEFVNELAAMHRLRYRVFKDRPRRDVQVSGDLEIDEFDALHPTYLLQRGGVALDLPPEARKAETGIAVATFELFAGMIEFGLSRRLTDIVTVTDARMEPILRRTGWPLRRIADPTAIGRRDRRRVDPASDHGLEGPAEGVAGAVRGPGKLRRDRLSAEAMAIRRPVDCHQSGAVPARPIPGSDRRRPIRRGGVFCRPGPVLGLAEPGHRREARRLARSRLERGRDPRTRPALPVLGARQDAQEEGRQGVDIRLAPRRRRIPRRLAFGQGGPAQRQARGRRRQRGQGRDRASADEQGLAELSRTASSCGRAVGAAGASGHRAAAVGGACRGRLGPLAGQGRAAIGARRGDIQKPCRPPGAAGVRDRT